MGKDSTKPEGEEKRLLYLEGLQGLLFLLGIRGSETSLVWKLFTN